MEEIKVVNILSEDVPITRAGYACGNICNSGFFCQGGFFCN